MRRITGLVARLDPAHSSPRSQRRTLALAAAFLSWTVGAALPVTAQDISDLKTPSTPLVLKAQGSFFVGGERVLQTGTQTGTASRGTMNGYVTINQMYVQYMIPQRGNRAPVVMLHGGTLSGKNYETTPDGRMGWGEYFVRRGHSVYIPDQVLRGRSGFNQAAYNDVRAARVPPSTQLDFTRANDELAWTLFRFGPTYPTPYPNTQFPVEAMDEFAKQNIPDITFSLTTPNPTIKAMSELATKLKGAVLMGHSQTGSVPLLATLLNPAAVKATIVIDGCPGTGGAELTDAQLATLVKVPMLGVLGDFSDPARCKPSIDRFTAAGGIAKLIYLPELKIFGNSHMIMNDKNNLQIADLMLSWLDKNVK